MPDPAITPSRCRLHPIGTGALSRREWLLHATLAAGLPAAGAGLAGCSTPRGDSQGSAGGIPPLRVSSAVFGTTGEGRSVRVHTLENNRGIRVSIAELGATITALHAPDHAGRTANILFGAESLEALMKGVPAASVIGRFANRIRDARFAIDGQEFRITANMGAHHIHGGREGFSSKLWTSRSWVDREEAHAEFRYRSPDGEEGFPGNLDVSVTYSLSLRNELTLAYHAVTDRPTVVNLTNHAYFNLAGAGQGDVLGHVLQILAAQYTPSDANLIPTGETAPVAGTPLDFRQPRRIGERISEIRGPRGYDHNYIIEGGGTGLRPAARVVDPGSGRVLDCSTTEPGVQLYTANHFDGTRLPRHGAFCLETQHFPDSPNIARFPSPVVRPGRPYHSVTVFRMSTTRPG